MGIIITVIVGVVGVLATAIFFFIQYTHSKKLPEKEAFIKAADKFRNKMMSFYNEISERIANTEEIGSSHWAMLRMEQTRQQHRRYIDEFRFSIPEEHRHRFNLIADKHCPPEELYSNDDINKMFWSDDDPERENQIRKDIKKNLEKLMDFTV